MALKGLDYFKFTPKNNCKACGKPTCMAFCMDVAAGKLSIDKCPNIKPEDLAKLSEASAPPMKTIKAGAGIGEYTLGGETVLYRHEKTYVSKTLYGVNVNADNAEAVLAEAKEVDYLRIGERMYTEVINVEFTGDKAAFLNAVKKAKDALAMPENPDAKSGSKAARLLILSVSDVAAATEALNLTKDVKPILNGANESNFADFSKLAKDAGVVLGVGAKDLDALYDTVAKIEAAGNKNLILDVGTVSIKDAFANAVQIRRAALKDQDRTFGYPSLINIGKLSGGNHECEVALASLFTVKYGSIVLLSRMNYAIANPIFGLRQNLYTDPQKPMRQEPGVYPFNNANADAINLTTVDFALTYFIVAGEIERSGIPANLIISDAGGYSVLTAWAAGKLTAGSVAKYIKEHCGDKCKNQVLVLPGKVAVLKGELEEALPGWKIIVGPNEAVGLVKFLKDFKSAA
ncbi:MAG: acetyl-CoA decarbonylase/synthase complex subunit gamma [Spirochaetaceae bacterium]|jgi:acetyl-CoA decarbonylase/synthase complex subunit gamma|nr:acetyl-CoA decarbonylase/synthase complex subunit gamma [Spirochaetaceae bacterium]